MKHIFALFVPGLSEKCQDRLEIIDSSLWNRVTSLLRLRVGEELIVFDGSKKISGLIDAATFESKKKLILNGVQLQQTKPLAPRIHFYPALLKKAAFEEVLYTAAALGVTSVHPVLCDKMHREKFEAKERERGLKIMIAACEQAKSFTLPELHLPISFDQVLASAKGTKNSLAAPHTGLLYFDATGMPATEFVAQYGKVGELSVVCGPEAGFSEQEMQQLDAAGFTKVALTPTILRAEHAAWVGLGMLRSLL